MNFLHPEFLWLLILLFAAAGSFVMKKRSALKSKEAWSLFGAVLSLLIALSRPYESSDAAKAETYGLDAVIAIDVSHSMSADDVKPTRFEAAKKMAKELISADGSNRYAIAAFTSNVLPLSPLSSDRDILYATIDSIDMENIITKSTDILKLLEKSAQILKSQDKVVIVFSDGGDSKEFSQEIAFAKKSNIKLLFVPVGTGYGAKLYDEYGEVIRDKSKRMVISSVNAYIKKAAVETGGRYYESFDAQNIAGELEALSTERSKQIAERKSDNEYFVIFLLLAFFLLLYGTSEIRVLNRTILLLVFISLQSRVDASPMEIWYEYMAKKSYEKREFEAAAGYYEKLAATNERYETAYNLANCYYKMGRFEQAAILYEAIKSDNPDFKSDVYYNLANTYAKKEEFEKADRSYLNSLLLRYESDADRNRRAVKKAKKGYKPDSMQKKGEGEKEKSSEPQKRKEAKNKKEPKEGDVGSKKINLSEDEEKMIKSVRGKKPLSYKQYQQINERARSDETNPW